MYCLKLAMIVDGVTSVLWGFRQWGYGGYELVTEVAGMMVLVIRASGTGSFRQWESFVHGGMVVMSFGFTPVWMGSRSIFWSISSG